MIASYQPSLDKIIIAESHLSGFGHWAPFPYPFVLTHDVDKIRSPSCIII
jgi:hypothetical protein